MEVADNNQAAMAEVGPQKKNRIQVSYDKKPLYFYVNLAKRYMQQNNEIELSAVGMAIGTVVTVAEILKNNGLAHQKKILASTVDTKDESKGRLIRKAKLEIFLGKTENFKKLFSKKQKNWKKDNTKERGTFQKATEPIKEEAADKEIKVDK